MSPALRKVALDLWVDVLSRERATTEAFNGLTKVRHRRPQDTHARLEELSR